jgi:heme/copper-type cytochrome/quinol oxidase subunit 1
MAPKAFATILLRVLGLWLAVDALSQFSEFLFAAWRVRRSLQSSGWTSYPPLGDITSTSESSLHDTYYVIAHSSVSLVSPSFKLLLGLILLFAAHRVARLLCAGVESTNSQ